jgi:hypothetical protein
MTGPYRVPDSARSAQGSEPEPGRAGELRGRQCARCGATGTHYLTCPGLRLPPGYRLGDAGDPMGGFRAEATGSSGFSCRLSR